MLLALHTASAILSVQIAGAARLQHSPLIQAERIAAEHLWFMFFVFYIFLTNNFHYGKKVGMTF